MNTPFLQILLADDDDDDRLFFKDAIDELRIRTSIITVNDGVELMEHLNKDDLIIPNVLFLDLNMPRKNGLQCLREIRSNELFNEVAIAIYSTSASEEDIEETFVQGANIYIRKPNDFNELKRIMGDVLSLNWQYHTSGLNRENFLLSI
jgi:CheY-like chemotaxis protein